MNKPAPSSALPATVNDCWNQIGVAGDRSCPELVKVVHCRNCPVLAKGGQELLDRAPPEGYLEQWRQVLATPLPEEKSRMLSLVLFRIGPEWLAMETAVFREATEPRKVHRLPHRKNPILTGMVSIRGELLLAVSLAALLEIDVSGNGETLVPEKNKSSRFSRLVVMTHKGDVWAFPVDELFGVKRVDQNELRAPPTTLTKAASTYTRAVLAWEGRTVGYLNTEAVFSGIRKRGL